MKRNKDHVRKDAFCCSNELICFVLPLVFGVDKHTFEVVDLQLESVKKQLSAIAIEFRALARFSPLPVKIMFGVPMSRNQIKIQKTLH